MTRYARLIGAIVQTRRPRLAAARDLALVGLESVPGVGPWLQAGALKPRLPREPVPQPMVYDAAAGVKRPLDELFGHGWALVARGWLPPADAATFAGAAPGPPVILRLGRDLDSSELDHWLGRRRAAAVLIRPDRVVEAFLGEGADPRSGNALVRPSGVAAGLPRRRWWNAVK
jgi:hypothetical protein